MKVASNRVEDVIHFFRQTLSSLYDESELNEIIFVVFNHYAHYSRQDMNTRLKDNLNQSELIYIYDACKALQQNIPVQYVLNEAWFYNRPFYVNKDVLIPRPETEELTELVLHSCKKTKELSVLDIGTGSGCIPITLSLEMLGWQVAACDVSEKALQVAQQNAGKLKAEVNFFKCDILKANALPQDKLYDVIISNPPYIQQEEATAMHSRVKEQEPHLALFVEDKDPSVFYKRIMDVCKTQLPDGGYLFFELNPLTSQDVKNYGETLGYFSSIELLNDMSGKCRFLKAIKKL